MIEHAIYELLKNDESLSTMLDDSAALNDKAIYLMAKVDSENPKSYIVHFEIDGQDPINLDASADHPTSFYQIGCYASGEDALGEDGARIVRELAQKITKAFNGKSFAQGKVRIERIIARGRAPAIEQGKGTAVHSVVMRFNIYYHIEEG